MEPLRRFTGLICSISAGALISSCGLVLPSEEAPAPERAQQIGEQLISGEFVALNGAAIELSDDQSRGQVLMFVSETCTVCRAETRALLDDFQARGVPTNITFYSIVVGSLPQDAADWGRALGVTWTIGTDTGDPLFRRYCNELQTPCVVLRNPATGRVTKLIGAHELSAWERATGTWLY